MLQCNYIRQAIDLLEGLIPRRDDNKDIPKEHLEKLILFAIMWSLGSLLEQSDRKKVGTCFYSICNIIQQIASTEKTTKH